jgi:hypothetical protein
MSEKRCDSTGAEGPELDPLLPARRTGRNDHDHVPQTPITLAGHGLLWWLIITVAVAWIAFAVIIGAADIAVSR